MLDNKSAEEEGKCNCPNCNPRLIFNEEDVYNYQIKPLLQKAKEIAIRNGIPILMATCYSVKKEDGEIKVLVDAGGAGREDWAPHSFVVARKMITSEIKGEFPSNGMAVAIGGGAEPGPMGGVGPAILAHILDKISKVPDPEIEERKEGESNE